MTEPMIDLMEVLLYDRVFQANFCMDCPECFVEGDFEDPRCERHAVYLNICAILKWAEGKIGEEMEWVRTK